MAAKSKTYEIAFALNGKTSASFNKTFNNANKMMSGLAKTAASIGGGIAVGKMATDAVQTFANFEQAMANVSAMTGETGTNLKQLELVARDMGKKTTKTATEAAEALNYMGLAGWDMYQMMEGIEPVLRLSEAGAIDLGRTSDLVTDSMSALGLEVGELQGFLDQVAKTAASSNTNIDTLMEAFLVVGGSFREMNTPLDEANALLGILANRGKKGSEAGNALSSILVNLTSGAGQAGDAMAALGVHAFDGNGKFKGITNVLLELNGAVSKLTEEDRIVALSEIGGKTQLDTLQALLAGVNAEYGDLRTKVADSDGALLKMAETMNDTTKGAWALFLSAMDEVKIKYASKLGPTFKELLKVASDKIPKGIDLVVTSFQALGEVFSGGVSVDTWDTLTYAFEALGVSAGETRDIIMSLQSGSEMLGEAFAYISGKAVEVYGVIQDNWSTIVPIIAGITGAMIANKVAILAMTAAQKGALIIEALSKAWTFASTAMMMLQSGTSLMTVAQWALNAAMTANPIGVVVVAIGALIAIGVALWQNWDTVKAKAFELWAGIQSAFGGVGEWFGGIWDGIKSTFKSFINFVIGGLNKIPQALNQLNFTVPDWIPGIGGKSMGFNLPMIPQFYKGTTGFNTPDTFIAGERGPELVTNAPGYKVFTANQTQNLFNQPQVTAQGSSRERTSLFNLNLPKWLPGRDDKAIGLNLPAIPGFYKGTTGFNTPDTFIAGERGPELVTNAPGYKVFTANQTKNIFNQSQATAQESSSKKSSLFNLNLPKVLPAMADKIRELNLPAIPGFYKGTAGFNTPDTFIAGERGPELVTNAPGYKVFTAGQTQNIFNQSQAIGQGSSREKQSLFNLNLPKWLPDRGSRAIDLSTQANAETSREKQPVFKFNPTLDKLRTAMADAGRALHFKVPEWAPMMASKAIGLNLPAIPGFYKGTNGFNTPDTFIAGERGPELVTNAPGYKVFAANQTQNLFKSSKRLEHGDSSEVAPLFTFNPVINIYDGSGDVEEKVQRAVQTAYRQWKKELKELLKGQGRLAFE